MGGEIRFLRQSPKALAMGDDNWIYSGDDLLFRGLSQSTIGDTGFPCLVRDGTEGGSRSIITRINPANIISFSWITEYSLDDAAHHCGNFGNDI